MNKDKYLIVIDLDGTLFKTVSDYDKYSTEVLKELSKDHIIVIATGRPFRSSKPDYDILGLTSPIINYNGCLTFNPKDSNYPKMMHTISKEDLFRFIELNKEYIINVFCEIEDDIYVNEVNDEIYYYLHADGGIVHEGDLTQILPNNPHGAMVFLKPNTSHIVSQNVINNFDGRLKFRSWEQSHFEFCELYDPYISKGTYIRDIQTYYGIDKAHTICIGDGVNDLEMFDEASIKVSMANGKSELKQKANYITKSIDESGVGVFLKHFFKHKR